MWVSEHDQLMLLSLIRIEIFTHFRVNFYGTTSPFLLEVINVLSLFKDFSSHHCFCTIFQPKKLYLLNFLMITCILKTISHLVTTSSHPLIRCFSWYKYLNLPVFSCSCNKIIFVYKVKQKKVNTIFHFFIRQIIYNHLHNIFTLFDALPNFSFTTSETMRNYYS